MRFVHGHGWVYQAAAGGGDANDGGGAGGGSSQGEPAGGADLAQGDTGLQEPDAGSVQGDAASVEQGADPAAKSGDKAAKPTTAADMQKAIDAGLGYKKEGDEDPALDPAKKAAAPAQKKNEKGEPIGEDGKVIAPKKKTVDELTTLSPDEKKALGNRGMARFKELTGTLKEYDSNLQKASAQVTQLSAAREALLGVMQETGTNSDDLAGLLEFNGLRKSAKPEEREQALKFLESHRASLLASLGREAEGVDLLAAFPDLAKEVDEERMTRAYALELASGRRAEKARTDAAGRAESEKKAKADREAKEKAEADSALGEIDKWVKAQSGSDLDYKAKEDRILAKTGNDPSMLEEVIREYPPHLWLPTIKRLWGGITVQGVQTGIPGQMKPMRPSAAKPGAKVPGTMKEAIDQGLNYTTPG